MTYVVHEKQETIKFLKEYYPLIRDNIKTQTMRLASKRLNVNEDDIVTAIFPGITDTLKIKITKIGYRQFKNIKLEDAKREGYDSVGDLKNDLLKIYPCMNKWDRLYYYQFELCDVK